MKTAMTSIASFFQRQLRSQLPDVGELHLDSHETLQEMVWRLPDGDEWYRDKYCILFSRNPYDRAVSFYHHMRQIGGHARGLCLRKTFSEFIREPNLIRIMRPMSDYTRVDGKDIVGFLGRYESLTDDVHRLVGELGLSDETKDLWSEAPRRMATEHEAYSSYYDESLADIVYHTYKEDFLLFDYRR